VVRAGSGHVYLDLKDDSAVISGVMWKGVATRQKIAPEQGMEVIASGKISTFPGQSKYQIIIDSIEPAGAGALMALLEERKKKLSAEGLFDLSRKKDLPIAPTVIGVVTSPSGAVIRDILHRLRDRYPVHVLVWPTLVQGRGAEQKIAEGIEGFNKLTGDDIVPRPDVLIVARGGGSLEDLWCFNEEVVVRAAANSEIPLISAVGHETDTTLIDYAADRRAPTPTAAAEMAVPVRSELLGEILNKARRLETGLSRLVERARGDLRAADRGLGQPQDVLGVASQRIDRAGDRLLAALDARRGQSNASYAGIASRLGVHLLRPSHRRGTDRLKETTARLKSLATGTIQNAASQFDKAQQLIETLSYKKTLARGFAIVRSEENALVTSVAGATAAGNLAITFADGDVKANVLTGAYSEGAGTEGATQTKPKATERKSVKSKKQKDQPAVQERLFD
ncbi:MAG: exodeoxyribonuclease VII large subunit, partial [Pseudomonadota bacterium]